MTNSQAKGKRAELDLANYLTDQGIPARRLIRTGDWRTTDEGDLRLDCAPVTIEVKHWAAGLSTLDVSTLLGKLERQSRPGDIGILVERLNRVADPNMWRAWLTVFQAERLFRSVHSDVRPAYVGDPVAFQLQTVVHLLHQRGWVVSTPTTT